MSDPTFKDDKRSGSLDGRTAIITGASSGIGRATALTLARAGAAVVCFARRKDALEDVCRQIQNLNGQCLTVAGDAGKPADIDALLNAAHTWREGGRKYDIVVVNAGRGLVGSTMNSDSKQWQELYQTNVLGAADLMRKAAQSMVDAKRGDLVVVGSVVGRNVSPFSAFYGSSKFAVGAIAEGLRQEVCAHGVRVSLVMPGIVVSEFQKAAGYTDDFFKGIAHMGKLLEPQAIADGIYWLLSQPPHVNISEIMIRPTGQHYP